MELFSYKRPGPRNIAPGQGPVIITAGSWPSVLLPMKLLAKPEDKGLGDIIERTIGPMGGDAFKKWYKIIFGRECGCNARREDWNVRWPL